MSNNVERNIGEVKILENKSEQVILGRFYLLKGGIQMIILNLRTYINRNYITSEHLHPTDMIGYMDSVIDDINEDKQSFLRLVNGQRSVHHITMLTRSESH